MHGYTVYNLSCVTVCKCVCTNELLLLFMSPCCGGVIVQIEINGLLSSCLRCVKDWRVPYAAMHTRSLASANRSSGYCQGHLQLLKGYSRRGEGTFCLLISTWRALCAQAQSWCNHTGSSQNCPRNVGRLIMFGFECFPKTSTTTTDSAKTNSVLFHFSELDDWEYTKT